MDYMRRMQLKQMIYLMNGNCVHLISQGLMASMFILKTKNSMPHFYVQNVLFWQKVSPHLVFLLVLQFYFCDARLSVVAGILIDLSVVLLLL